MGREIPIFTPLEQAYRDGEIPFEEYLQKTVRLIRRQVKRENTQRDEDRVQREETMRLIESIPAPTIFGKRGS